MTSLVELANDKWKVVLAPEIGGSIVSCEYDGQHILRPAPEASINAKDVWGMASWPLIPFSNRIKNGEFDFQGRHIKLPRNMGDHPHTIHGSGWQRPWTNLVAGVEQSQYASLHYDHPPGDWPWHFTAIQEFSVSGNYFSRKMTVVNHSDTPMPVGLGFHDQFNYSDDMILTADAPKVWEATDECLPTMLVDTPERWDFSKGRKLAGLKLDHCFAGWDGNAKVEWPGERYAVRIKADPLQKHLVIYTGTTSIEPVTNMNDAFNAESNRNWQKTDTLDTGAVILLPNSDISVITNFIIEPAGMGS